MIEDIKLYLKEDDFFEVGTVQEINNEYYEYVWGGCLVNKKTGIIDRYINKQKTKVCDVRYVPCIWGGRDSFEVWMHDRFIGYITQDYKFQAPMMQGGGYWLTGITTSYEILREREAARKRSQEEDDSWIREFIKGDR